MDKETRDLTKWLEYFTEGVNVSLSAVKERVLRLSSEKLRKNKKGQIALTERQMRIIEHINMSGNITNREVRKMFTLSNRVALDEINKLIELEILEPKGKGRNTHYVLL